MAPADQRLGADDATGGVHLRLVEQLEFLQVERLSQAGFDRQPFAGPHAQSGLEKPVAVPAAVLRFVQRHVGAGEQGLGIVAIVGEHADPDAHRDPQIMAGDAARPGDRGDDVCRRPPRIVGVGQLREHDHELVPALTADRVRAPDAPCQFAPDGVEQFVPQQVSQRVVDLLEAIDVQKEDRHPALVTMGQRERVHQTVAQQQAVREIGQRIVARRMGQLSRRLIGAPPQEVLTEQGVAEDLQQFSVLDEPLHRDRWTRIFFSTSS